MKCLQTWWNCSLRCRQSVLIDTAYIGFRRSQTWNLAEQAPLPAGLFPDSVPCADPILRATPPKSWPISSASGRRHRIAPSANNPKSCAVMKCSNAPTTPSSQSIYSYSWNRWKEWRTSLIPPLSRIDLATPGQFHRDRSYGSLCITPLLHNYPTKRGQIGLVHTATWS